MPGLRPESSRRAPWIKTFPARHALHGLDASAGIFVHWGINLPMSVRALAMNLSTVIVAVTARFLRHFRL